MCFRKGKELEFKVYLPGSIYVTDNGTIAETTGKQEGLRLGASVQKEVHINHLAKDEIASVLSGSYTTVRGAKCIWKWPPREQRANRAIIIAWKVEGGWLRAGGKP